MPGSLHAATATPAPLPQTTIPRSHFPSWIARNIERGVGIVVLRAHVDGLVALGAHRIEHDVVERDAGVGESDCDLHRRYLPSSRSCPASSVAPRTPACGP